MPELTPDAWAQIRYAYEHTPQTIEAICAAHGISSGTLRDRMRRWGWKRRRPPISREGPPAIVMPEIEMVARNPWPLGPRLRGDERSGDAPGQEQVVELEATPTLTLPLSGGGNENAARDDELSPHRECAGQAHAPLDSNPAPIGQRLQGAVARVLPAIEATLAKLAFAPGRPRDMEQMARALGSLTRTLRELNGLLAQHDTQAEEPPVDIDALRRELARRVEALVARQNAEMPRRYEAAWHEFAAEVEGGAGATEDCRTAPSNP